MKDRICALSKNDLKDLVKTYRIPLDLHPRLPDVGFTMDHLPADAIGIYSEFLRFFGVRVPFLTFLLSVLKYFKDDLPSDGYDRDDVQRLCACLICIREMREEVLVRSRLSSVWFDKDYDPVFRWIGDNAGRLGGYKICSLFVSDAKIVEESHHLSLLLLERVPSHTIAPASEGAIIPLPTPVEIAASLPDPRLAKKSKGPSLVSRPSKKRKLQKRASKAGSSSLELGHAEGVDEADFAD
ncbi:hypothetical protein Tco_1542605, partial [Tanacetum coccineum]